jgi:hypothetical protein
VRVSIVASAVALALVPGVVFAEDPTLPFEGFLTGADDTPVEGMVELEIRIYDVEVDGTPVFEERQTTLVAGGFFQLEIGASVPLPASLFLGEGKRYLGLALAGEDEFVPQFVIGFVPYAIRALHGTSSSSTSADSHRKTHPRPPQALQ